MSQPNIFNELEADIEHQRLEDLWRRVGPYVIAAGVAIMLVTGGYSAWHSWYDRLMNFGHFGDWAGDLRHLLSSSHVSSFMSLDQVGSGGSFQVSCTALSYPDCEVRTPSSNPDLPSIPENSTAILKSLSTLLPRFEY